MPRHRALTLICFSTILCHAQTPTKDQTLITQARAKYDAPFTRNLQSFDCAVTFSWKQHFTETTRVGDEGTDEELETIFKPLHTRVIVTPKEVTVSSGLTDDAVTKLPHGGMAELLLEHAIRKSLETWLPAATNTIIPTPATMEKSPSGYKLSFKMQDTPIDMAFTPDLRLESATMQSPQPIRIDTTFTPGPQGFLLASWTIGEDGSSAPGQRLIFTYTYQTVEGIQLPEDVVVNRESHHEIWRYKLTGCKVKTTK